MKVLKEDQNLINKLDLFVKAFDDKDLPEKVKIWTSGPNTFGYIFVVATVSAKIMELNIAVDLLHMPVNLLELETAEAITDKVMDLADMVRQKYGQIFD